MTTKPTQRPESQVTDPDHTRIVDEFHVIFRPVVLIVEARKEPHEGNPCLPETDMIGATGAAGGGDGQAQIGLVGVGRPSDRHREEVSPPETYRVFPPNRPTMSKFIMARVWSRGTAGST